MLSRFPVLELLICDLYPCSVRPLVLRVISRVTVQGGWLRVSHASSWWHLSEALVPLPHKQSLFSTPLGVSSRSRLHPHLCADCFLNFLPKIVLVLSRFNVESIQNSVFGYGVRCGPAFFPSGKSSVLAPSTKQTTLPLPVALE